MDKREKLRLAAARGDIIRNAYLFFSLAQGHTREKSDAAKQPSRTRQRMRADNASGAAGSQVLPRFTLKIDLNARIPF